MATKSISKNKGLEKRIEEITMKMYGNKSIQRGNGAVIYTRVSSSEQANNNGSLDVQMKYCNEYCKRMQLNIVGYFGGTHESAKTDGRKEFQRMLSFAKKNKNVSHIVIFNYDRFSRTGSAAAQLSLELRKIGIITKSVTQDIDTSTASGRLQEDFFHMLNNFDNRTKSDRTKINTREVMEKGYWPYMPPLGYKNLNPKHRACNHKLVITDEGKELRRAFKLKAEGMISNKDIIALLNARGVKLTEKNFRWIISNPFYTGHVTGKLLEGRLVKGQHPALIDMETFLKANDSLDKAPCAGIPKQFKHEEVPLKVFTKEVTSGIAFTGYQTKGHWYYKTKNGGTPVNIKAEKLNNIFKVYLEKFEYKKEHKSELNKLITKQLAEKLKNSKEDNVITKRKIAEKQSQVEKIEEKFILEEISKEQFEKYSSKYKEEIKLLSQNMGDYDFSSSNLQNAINKCLNIAENISSAWVLASFDQKIKLQHLLFPQGIVYDKEKVVVRTLKTNSVFDYIPMNTRVLEDKKKGNSKKNCLKSDLVPETGFEPAHPFEYHHLKVACLPISTPGRGLQMYIIAEYNTSPN